MIKKVLDVYENILVPQLVLSSIVMQNAQIFNRGPVIVFELVAFSSDFKIDYIMVWQLILLNKKILVSSGKFNIFISGSPICTPLILVLVSIKIASTS